MVFRGPAGRHASLGLSVVTPAELIHDSFAKVWARPLSWERTDVHKNLATAIARSDESKSPLVVPASEFSVQYPV